MTSPDATVQNVIDDLDSLYCHNIVASLWADAVADPRQLIDRAPDGIEFTIPDCSDPQAISYAMAALAGQRATA